MNKIILRKTTSAIFLAIVIVLGTIATILPSGQAEQYYKDRYYTQGYEPDYPSYQDNNYYKSKDSKSVSINKLKCINTNLNINGNNAGNIDIGNKDSANGTLDAYSFVGGSGYDGHNKKDKGFDCTINNNNTNTNIVIGEGGNVTDGNGNVTEPQTCEECFKRFLTPDEISDMVGSSNLEEFCDAIESGLFDENLLRLELADDVSMATIEAVVQCLKNLGILTS